MPLQPRGHRLHPLRIGLGQRPNIGNSRQQVIDGQVLARVKRHLEPRDDHLFDIGMPASRMPRGGLMPNAQLFEATQPSLRRRCSFTTAHELFHCLEHLPLMVLRNPRHVLKRQIVSVEIGDRLQQGLRWFEWPRFFGNLLVGCPLCSWFCSSGR